MKIILILLVCCNKPLLAQEIKTETIQYVCIAYGYNPEDYQIIYEEFEDLDYDLKIEFGNYDCPDCK